MSSFKELYHADMTRYGGGAEVYLKVFHYLFRSAATAVFPPARLLYRVLFRFWASRRGLEITANEQIGGGIYLGHAYNITINSRARIGRNCNIHKGVVVGQANRGVRKGCPIIGDRVWIGINAAIVGKVTIGDDVLIAPNSFVNIDVPPHSVVFGNPCAIKHRDCATEGYVNHIVEESK